MSTIDKARVVANLDEEWTAIDALLTPLSPADWGAPSTLPGWSVRDIVAHLVGTECWLEGQEPPLTDVDVASLSHVRNEIAERNERWVLAMRPEEPGAVLARFRAVTRRRLAALRAMPDEEFHRASWTPAGQGTYARFMRIRLYDCWLHEQDIRAALGRPGHEDGPCAEMAIDEVADALGYLVGKRAGAPHGTSVTLRLTGPVHRELHVQVEGRAKPVDRLPGPPTATLALSSTLFTRLTGGREDPLPRLGEIELGGEEALARRIALNLAFTI